MLPDDLLDTRGQVVAGFPAARQQVDEFGEKQRVAIARAFCNDPDVILADEPTGNLDHQTSEQIHELLFRFANEKKKALAIVTHDNELANLCSKQYLLADSHLSVI